MIAENVLVTSITEKGDIVCLQQGKSRRMKLLERMGCFGPLPAGVKIYRASTLSDLCEAYRLVYDNFLKLGYILPNSSSMRIRLFEAMPETATFVAKANGKIVGVTSVVIDTPELGLPADKAFKPEIDNLRRKGRIICEGTNWIITPEYRRTPVMTELMRCCFAHAVANHCTDLLADITPTHKSFYELMDFKAIGSERSSSPDLDDPVVLVDLPIAETLENVADLGIEDDFMSITILIATKSIPGPLRRRPPSATLSSCVNFSWTARISSIPAPRRNSKSSPAAGAKIYSWMSWAIRFLTTRSPCLNLNMYLP